MKTILYIFSLMLIVSCNKNSNNVEREIQNKNDIISTQENIDYSDEEIAKFAICTLMNKQYEDLKSNKQGDRFIISYSIDNKSYNYKVKVNKSEINWGNADGRWRNNKFDSSLFYEIDGENLIITEVFNDGTKTINKHNKLKI